MRRVLPFDLMRELYTKLKVCSIINKNIKNRHSGGGSLLSGIKCKINFTKNLTTSSYQRTSAWHHRSSKPLKRQDGARKAGIQWRARHADIASSWIRCQTVKVLSVEYMQ
jgi:hypothetical protein